VTLHYILLGSNESHYLITWSQEVSNNVLYFTCQVHHTLSHAQQTVSITQTSFIRHSYHLWHQQVSDIAFWPDFVTSHAIITGSKWCYTVLCKIVWFQIMTGSTESKWNCTVSAFLFRQPHHITFHEQQKVSVTTPFLIIHMYLIPWPTESKLLLQTVTSHLNTGPTVCELYHTVFCWAVLIMSHDEQ